jgi:hypothetical protein
MAYGFPVFIAPGSCCNSWCHAEQVKHVYVFFLLLHKLLSPKEARVPLQTSCMSIIPAISQPPVGLVRSKQHLVLKWAWVPSTYTDHRIRNRWESGGGSHIGRCSARFHRLHTVNAEAAATNRKGLLVGHRVCTPAHQGFSTEPFLYSFGPQIHGCMYNSQQTHH